MLVPQPALVSNQLQDFDDVDLYTDARLQDFDVDIDIDDAPSPEGHS
jgi:hypothetical protein